MDFPFLPTAGRRRIFILASQSAAGLAAELNALIAQAALIDVGPDVLTVRGLSDGGAGAGGMFAASLTLAQVDAGNVNSDIEIEINRAAVVAVEFDAANEQGPLQTALQIQTPPVGPNAGERLQLLVGGSEVYQVTVAGSSAGHRFAGLALVRIPGP